MFWLSLLTTTALANDVLVPSLTSADATSRVGAEIVYSSLVEALSDRDISFLDADDLRRFIGHRADDCSKRPTCPQDLWADLNGDIALKGTVTMVGEDINASLKFYRRGVPEPIEFFQADFPEKKAGYFAVDAALIVEDLLKMSDEDLAALGVGVAATAGAVAASAQPSPSPQTEEPGPIIQDALGPIPQDEPVTPTREANAEQPEAKEADASGADPEHLQAEEERREIGLPVSLFKEFKASGQTREAFLEDIKFRGKTFYIEASPGLVFGDVQRRYTAIAQIVAGQPKAYYERDQFLPGTAFSLTAGFGYAPTWWLEVGLNLGIELPKKDLVTGYEQYADAGADWESGHNCPEFCDLTAFQPATAMAFVVEPRVRFLVVPRGLIKPYFVYGWATRFYDGYDSPDYRTVSYPNRSGTQSYGPVAGFGSGFDTNKRASAFLEMAYTHLLGPGIYTSGNNAIQLKPKAENGINGLITIRAGFVSRF